MSTHTVYGCYFASTGKFEFDDTECPDATITGCRVESGEHAGEIEITHDYGGCETQYYACYDPTTGKFEFEVDDGCCEEECEACEHAEECPRYVKITIEGVEDCGGEDVECTDMNGVYVAECTLYYGQVRWIYTDGTIQVHLYFPSCGSVSRCISIQGVVDGIACFQLSADNMVSIGPITMDICGPDGAICGGELDNMVGCAFIEGTDGTATWEASDAFGNACSC